MGALRVVALEVGQLATGCYLVHREGEAACAVIDPGGDAETVAARLDGDGLAPAFLLATHSHFDHIAGLAALKARYPEAVIACHAECNRRMQSPQLNLGFLIGVTTKGPAADRELADGETLAFGTVALACRHAPGHAPGHLLFHADADRVLFSGDVLFQGSMGRTDFDGCSHDDLMESLRREVLPLPDETVVYPGHGPSTTVGEEKRTNPFLRELLL